MYSWCSVKSHDDHWDHWSQESGGHVSGWALGTINTFHVDLDIVHGHTKVDWCELVVHASEHLVLFSSSLVGHNDIDTAHFAELWSATLACVRALCDTWADFHAGSIHSVLEEFVELNSLFEHLSITVLYFGMVHFDWVSISIDRHLLSVSGHASLNISSRVLEGGVNSILTIGSSLSIDSTSDCDGHISFRVHSSLNFLAHTGGINFISTIGAGISIDSTSNCDVHLIYLLSGTDLGSHDINFKGLSFSVRAHSLTTALHVHTSIWHVCWVILSILLVFKTATIFAWCAKVGVVICHGSVWRVWRIVFGRCVRSMNSGYESGSQDCEHNFVHLFLSFKVLIILIMNISI